MCDDSSLTFLRHTCLHLIVKENCFIFAFTDNQLVFSMQIAKIKVLIIVQFIVFIDIFQYYFFPKLQCYCLDSFSIICV